MTLRLLVCTVLVAVFALGGCTSRLARGPAPVDPSETAPPTVRSDYRIGPGDTVQVFVWRNPEISVVVPVRPDGRISTPLVEDMVAVGKTPTQLARDVEKALSRFIRSPVVTVIVTQFVGTFAEKIRVAGQATQPQALSFREQMTLLDVMIEVGGLGEFAAGNRATVVRWVDGKRKVIPVRIEDLLREGDISANIDMRPGDILIIPESMF